MTTVSRGYTVLSHDVFTAFPTKQDYDYDKSSSNTGGNESAVRGRQDNLRKLVASTFQREFD